MRPSIPPRPSVPRAVSSRLAYPRLAPCEIGYFAGPACPPAAAVPAPALELPAEGARFNPAATSFALEEKVMRTLETLQAQWETEASERSARVKARAEAVEARVVAEALAASQAEAARQAALEELRRAEAAKAAAAAAARKAAEEEEAKLREEERALEEKRAALEAEQKEHARRRALFSPSAAQPVAMPVAVPVAAHAAASGVAASASASASVPSAGVHLTPAQHASQRSFMELTGVNNAPQVGLLLSLLNHDLDRAIGLFFATDPPTLEEALAKARSIQRHAWQQQQKQQQQQQQQAVGGAAISPNQQQPQHHQQHPSPPSHPPYSYYPAPPPPPPSAFVWHGSQVKVLLPDGSPQLVSCAPSDTLWTLYSKVSSALQSRVTWANKPIKFVPTPFAGTPFGEDKFDTTLGAVFAGVPPHAEASLRIELSR